MTKIRRKKFSVSSVEYGTDYDVFTPIDKYPDMTEIKRLEFDEEDARGFKIVGDTLFVGRNHFLDGLTNAETGKIYFPEGHPLYDLFSHNAPE